MPKEKILFIFGAGASFDSLDTQNGTARDVRFQPPVTNGIFSNNMIVNNLLDGDSDLIKLTQLIPEIRQEILAKKSLESVLEEYAEQAKTLPHRQKQLDAIGRYLRKLFYECSKQYIRFGSNYGRLIDRLITHDKQAIFVTFNYDTLLEKELEHGFDTTFKFIEDYTGCRIPLIKVHGSWNWYYNKSEKGRVTVLHHRNTLETLKGTDPALGLPYRQAKKFIVPEHIEFLKNELRHVEKIVIIGWRGNEQHFMPELQSNLGKFELVVVNKGQEECDNVYHLFPELQVSNYKGYPDGFTDFLNAPDFLTYI